MKNELTVEQKRLETDIEIIAFITLAGFILYMVLSNSLAELIDDNKIPILIRTIVIAFIQFSIAGLGSLIVCFKHKDTFQKMGLCRKGSIKAILSTTLFFVPYFIYLLVSGQFNGYMPLSVLITEHILADSLLNKILGMLIVGISWGFFEGFNYYIVSKVINQRYPSKINIGAITCAFICILLHPFGTSFWGIIEMIVTFIFIYGMISCATKAKNAWGCIFAFLFLWNAF
ncbi:MAG TPA: hypothetical protein IAA11_05850 [Candidatus Blautia intestinigallinarum]|nr:hypothetical protein [Candidatus Blautia intestinigallinarum]